MNIYDVIVIGAGPVGLIATQEALSQKKSVLLIDKDMGANYSFSPLDLEVSNLSKGKLGGIGGTSNIWHGQGVRFPREFIESYFVNSREWNYLRYSSISEEVEKIFGLTIEPDNNTKLFKRLRELIQEYRNVQLRVSHIPTKIDSWESIFKKVLQNSKLEIKKCNVQSLEFTKNYVSKIITDTGEISVNQETLIILAANSLGNVEILLRSEEKNNILFPGIGRSLYDHPHAVCLTFDARGNFHFLSNSFTYLVKKLFKVKVKKKFVVVNKNHEIGIFEIHPKYSMSRDLNLMMKISYKFLSKLFHYPLLKPERIEVWIQIEQDSEDQENVSERIFKLDKDQLIWEYSLGKKDLARFEFIAAEATSILGSFGFGLERSHLNSDAMVFDTAAHPSGTIRPGYQPTESSFSFEGRCNIYSNLMVAGGALIGTGSWVNPTLPIMTMTLGNVRSYLCKSEH